MLASSKNGILNTSHFPFAMTTKGFFFQFHSSYSSTDDPFGPSKRAVSSHPAFLPVVIQENPFSHNFLDTVTIGQEHASIYRASAWRLYMQPVYKTWPYYPATHFYREDGSSMPHRNADIYLQDWTLSQTIRPSSGQISPPLTSIPTSLLASHIVSPTRHKYY